MNNKGVGHVICPNRFAFSAVGLAFLLLCTATNQAAGQDQPQIPAGELTDEHVLKAIDAIVEELYARKDPQRFWDPIKPPSGESTTQGGGYTALTVLSLLYAGQSYQDPRLRDAIDYLADYSMGGTYAVSVRTAVWAKLPDRFQDQLGADVRWLLDGFSPKAAGWTYQQQPNTTVRDNSITQFGALALWEAVKRGARINPALWRAMEERFVQMQTPEGGWNYRGDGPPTGSMTTAGLATLFITQDLLHTEDAIKLRTSPEDANEKAIARGMEWMNTHFSPVENPGRFSDFYYYLYGVERVGLAGGRKYFGKHDWFREGAAELIRRLCHWDEETRTMTVHEKIGGAGRAARVRVRHLTFALMFLSRGRAPVAFNKLQAAGVAWNNRPRDVANLTDWISKHSEQTLAWQIVDMNTEPEEWLDAPVLYFASDRAPEWLSHVQDQAKRYVRESREFMKRRAAGEIPNDAEPPAAPRSPELAKLKRLLDLGGLIFAVGEGRGRAFARSIEQAGLVMYPQYEWRNLPRDHWAYSLHFAPRARRPNLKAMSNGVRELIILAPAGDLAGSYQARDEKMESHFQTAANIYFHASEMNRPRSRLTAPATPAPEETEGSNRLLIVRAIHAGNWNPEPLAMPRFAEHMAHQHGIGLEIRDIPLSMIGDLDHAAALVLVSGIDDHEFTDAEKQAIRAFVESEADAEPAQSVDADAEESEEEVRAVVSAPRPILLFETPGGRGGFTESAEKMAADLLDSEITPLSHHAIITGEGLEGAGRLSTVGYRQYSFEVFGDRETIPRLAGMEHAGRMRIVFSRQDLSHALLDRPAWSISGYTGDSARALLANIIRYASQTAATEDADGR